MSRIYARLFECLSVLGPGGQNGLSSAEATCYLEFFFLGRFFRLVLAKSFNCFSLIDSAICFDAPLREDFFVSPRFAASAAPAAICCFFDFAGIFNHRSRFRLCVCSPGVRAAAYRSGGPPPDLPGRRPLGLPIPSHSPNNPLRYCDAPSAQTRVGFDHARIDPQVPTSKKPVGLERREHHSKTPW